MIIRVKVLPKHLFTKQILLNKLWKNNVWISSSSVKKKKKYSQTHPKSKQQYNEFDDIQYDQMKSINIFKIKQNIPSIFKKENIYPTYFKVIFIYN